LSRPLGGVAWLDPVAWLDEVARGCGFGLCAAFGLGPGKWLTFRITVPARSLQMEGFGLPVAAVAVIAIAAAPTATSAGAKRHARLTRLAALVR
jgi:hypothetical protein